MIERGIVSDSKFDGGITTLSLRERAESQMIREDLAKENFDPKLAILENEDALKMLPETPFRSIGQRLVKGESLGFDYSFLGMVFVVAATNKGIYRELKPSFEKAHGVRNLEQGQLLGPAQTFLTTMAQKETQGVLTEEEVAGMVACTMMDLNLRLRFNPYILETGGMGGDKGFIVNGERKKIINASTLSAIVLSSLGIPVLKHGSYANTSAVGSTEAVRALGINFHQSSFAQIQDLFNKTRFYFSDAHVSKTIHDLSHSPFMRHETINHIIGPMTPPVDKRSLLCKIIGVNEGVHPGVVARAYEILNAKGVQRVGNVISISGLSKDFNRDVDINDSFKMRDFMMLDEVSPYQTLVGVVRKGKYQGCFLLDQEDFGAKIDPEDIQVVNSQEELLAANGQALRGLSKANSDYLAMNAALGLFVSEYLEREDAVLDGGLNTNYLKESFTRCQEEVVSGKALNHLYYIIRASNA